MIIELLQCKSQNEFQESLKSLKFVYEAKCYSVIIKKWGIGIKLMQRIFGQDLPSQAIIIIELLQCKSQKKFQESLMSLKFVYEAKCYSVILKKRRMERHLLNK